MSLRQVKIIYPFTDTQPPVYLLGTFTHPPWTPIKMTAVPTETLASLSGNASVQLQFECVLDLSEGVWEYKFRVGESHWVYDESAPTVTNEQGFVNNLLIIEGLDNNSGLEEYTISQKSPTGCISSKIMKEEFETESSAVTKASQGSPKPYGCPEMSTELNQDLSANDLWETEPKLTSPESQSPLKSNRNNDKSASDSELSIRSRRLGRFTGSFRDSNISTESLKNDRSSGEFHRTKSAADIEKVSYIMAMPREDGSSELADIMAYQDSQILRLSPDYTSAVPLPTEECSPSGAPFLPHEQFSSHPSTPVRGRSSTLSSVQPSLSVIEHEPVVAPEATLQDLQDPNVERFPEDREDILQRLQALQEQDKVQTDENKTKGQYSNILEVAATLAQEHKQGLSDAGLFGDGTVEVQDSLSALPVEHAESCLAKSGVVNKIELQRCRNGPAHQCAGSKRSHSPCADPTGSTRMSEPGPKRRRADDSVSDAKAENVDELSDGNSRLHPQLNLEPSLLYRIWAWLRSVWQRLTRKGKEM